MEQRELLLLEKYAAVNPELKELWEDHILYEKRALLGGVRHREGFSAASDYHIACNDTHLFRAVRNPN